MKLDLKEAPTASVLALVGVAADQAAANLGTEVVVVGVESASMSFALDNALGAANADRLRGVFIAHLSRRLGAGFTVFADYGDRISVALEGVEPETGEEATGDDAEQTTEAAPRRRGRPLGTKNKP